MPSKHAPESTFPLLACALLLLQMLSPLAFAQRAGYPASDAAAAFSNQPVSAIAPYGLEGAYLDSTHSTFTNSLSAISLQSAGSSVAGCELKEVTAAQYKRLMDSIFNSEGGKFTPFQGKEITDRPDTSLKALPAANSGTVNVNVYNFPQEETTQFMTAKEFAQLASAPGGKSVNDVLKDIENELGVGPEDQLSITQARLLSAKKNYGNSLQNSLNSLVSRNKAKAGEPTLPGFEAMKVRLPTGVELPVGDLMKTPAIASRFSGGEKSCLLNDASITGKLSYRALLDKNLTIAGDRAEVAKKPKDQDKQHINTDGFQASFQNYDGNVVIPRQFERAVEKIGHWAWLDFMFSSVISIYSMAKLADSESLIKHRKESVQAMDEIANKARAVAPKKAVEALDSDYGNQLKYQVSEALKVSEKAPLQKFPDRLKEDVTQKLEAYYALTDPNTAGAQAAAEFGPIEKAFEEAALNGAESQLDSLATNLAKTPAADLFPEGSTKVFMAEGKSLAEADKLQSVIHDVDVENLERAGKIVAPKALSSAVLGLAWMGPARFAFEISGAVFFSSVGSPEKTLGTRLVVFANNKNFANTFKEATDWFMTGRALELLNDFTNSGTPSKVFSVDNVQLIQTMGDTGEEKLSRTVLAQQDGQWVVQPTWLDQSTATLFEDVRDGKKVSSMAINVNTSVMSLGLRRKKEAEAYYGTVAALAPILLMTFHLIPDVSGGFSGIATLVRLEILDSFLENFVDPVQFSEKEKCKDETLDWYVNRYRDAVIATQAFQVVAFTPFGAQLRGLDTVKNTLNAPIIKQTVDFYKYTAVVDPVGMAKASLAGLAMEYASTCKDSQYKIMAYQRLPDKVPVSALKKVQEKTANAVGLGDVMKGLNIGKSFETFVGSQLKAADLKEILNLRVLLQNQNGQVRPSELYEVHIEPSSEMQKVGPYGPEAGCFRNCLVNDKGKFVCLDDQRGVYDEKGTIIADKDFATNSYFIPKLGNVIPTKIIVSPLDCTGGFFSSTPVFASARASDASVALVDATCGTKDCLKSKLAQVTGFAGGDALTDSNWFGGLKAIHTTLGVASVHQNEFKFVYKTGVQVKRTATGGVVERLPFVGEGVVGNLPGVADTPKNAIEARSGQDKSGLTRTETSLTGVEKRLGEIDLFGDGKVRVKGADGSKPEDELGELRTVEFENGVLHYDPLKKRLVGIIHKLADIPAASIQTLAAQPASAESPKKALEKEKGEVDALKNALQANKALDNRQQELLKQMLDRIASGQNAFNAAELAALRDALQKLAQGKTLSPAEAALLERARQQPIFPGVLVVPGEKIDKIGNALKEGGATQQQADALKNKLQNQVPLSLDEKKAAEKAIDSAKASGKVSQAEADDLKKAVDGATSPAARAAELSQAIASGATLTPQQEALKRDLLNQIAGEQTRLASEIASAPAIDIPGVKLGPVVAKPGQEANARKLNTALDKLGTLTDFKTDKSLISFGSDASGNAVIRVGNRETGAVDTLKLTGPATRDGNAIVFPTDKGPMRFEFNMDKDTGAPTINIAGPNINEKSPLLLAQGKDGFIWFDPATGTWRVGPGMVVPTDGLFGKTGAQFQGSADGTRGFAGQDKFTPPNTALEPSVGFPSSNPLLSLPSWPENIFGIVAMLLAVLAGVLVTRVSYRKVE